METRITQNSFSKGILSPSLQGRVDLEQYSNGLKNLENGIVLQEGCVLNRSGLEYVSNTKYSSKKSRLIPFVFGLEQNYIIEVGEKHFRFVKDGGYILDDSGEIYEIASPYLEDEIFQIDYVQQLDSITLVHKNHKIQELSRIKHNVWELKEIEIKPKIEPPKEIKAGYSGSTSSNTKTYSYVVCSVDKETNEESSKSESVEVVAHKEAYWTTSEYVQISWQKVEGALEYNIYKSANGIFGYVGTSKNLNFIDNNIEPDLTSCAPTSTNPFEQENPSCVCYFQQRKIYASSKSYPQSFWASQSASNNNFNISRPLNATDAISMSLCDNVASEIQFLLPFDDLLVMTTNSEWAVNGSDGVFSANPAPVSNIQSFYGTSKVKPVVSGSMVLFVQSGGNIVRDLGYNYLSDSYDGEELSLFASQLFKGRKIVDMAYAKEPYRILWCVLDNGEIRALTYNPKQKIAAWHIHKTKGEFESVCSIREEKEDICYFVVKRKINGEEKRFVERFKSRTYDSIEDSFLLDCAQRKVFEEPVSRISNLDYLKGESVSALLDCGVVENLKVNEEGEVVLPYKAKNILIGLPFIFKMETLNFENIETLGLKKNANEISIKILNSREDFYIENDSKTLSQGSRSLDSINNPKKLFSKNVVFSPLATANIEKNATIVQNKPIPLCILALSANLSVQDRI